MVDVQKATKTVTQRLDANFFKVRFDRLTSERKRYLRAMAELKGTEQRSGDIANVLELK